MEKKLVSVKELSEITGLSCSTIYTWVSQRRIPFVKVGRLTKFELEKIEKWLETNRHEVSEFN